MVERRGKISLMEIWEIEICEIWERDLRLSEITISPWFIRIFYCSLKRVEIFSSFVTVVFAQQTRFITTRQQQQFQLNKKQQNSFLHCINSPTCQSWVLSFISSKIITDHVQWPDVLHKWEWGKRREGSDVTWKKQQAVHVVCAVPIVLCLSGKVIQALIGSWFSLHCNAMQGI